MAVALQAVQHQSGHGWNISQIMYLKDRVIYKIKLNCKQPVEIRIVEFVMAGNLFTRLIQAMYSINEY